MLVEEQVLLSLNVFLGRMAEWLGAAHVYSEVYCIILYISFY